MTRIASCLVCGYHSKPLTERQAAYALTQHSCERHQRIRERAARGRARLSAVDRTPKPCLHKHADHQHGHYATYTLDGCRCLPCSAAASGYERALRRRAAYGRHTLVDAEPVRAHVRALMAQGMGWKRVAREAGVTSSVVGGMLYGKPDRAPAKRIRAESAHRLLAVGLDLAGHALTDATGTHRRLQALQAIGWSKSALARELGHRAPSIQYLGPLVHVDTVRGVRDLFERLWDTDGGNTRARNLAVRNGWPPPLYWLDEEIDDPLYVVDYHPYRPQNQRALRAERAVEVAALTAKGLSTDQIATRLGVCDRTVTRLRADLAQEAA